VIPYGLDLSIFQPGPRREARERLGLPAEARILLCAASGLKENVWKDFRTMREAVARLAQPGPGSRLLFLALGGEGPPERLGEAEIRFLPFQRERARVALHYQAADLYLHAARADTFPNAVLEALACGLPVAATAVGGIPEQVRSLEAGAAPEGEVWAAHGAEEATGILTPPGDAGALAGAVGRLLADETLRERLGRNAAADARARFDLKRQVNEYLDWYREILEAWSVPGVPGAVGGRNGPHALP
jgi:glycosyltransferase involved in cell wall biosynthesis